MEAMSRLPENTNAYELGRLVARCFIPQCEKTEDLIALVDYQRLWAHEIKSPLRAGIAAGLWEIVMQGGIVQ